MNIRSRLMKLEAEAGSDKILSEMSDAELERFMCEHLGVPTGTPVTNDMLLQVVLDDKARLSRLTHEEALDLLD